MRELENELRCLREHHEENEDYLSDAHLVLTRLQDQYTKIFAPAPPKNYKIIVTVSVGDKTWQKSDPGVYPCAIIDRVEDLGTEITLQIDKAYREKAFPE